MKSYLNKARDVEDELMSKLEDILEKHNKRIFFCDKEAIKDDDFIDKCIIIDRRQEELKNYTDEEINSLIFAITEINMDENGYIFVSYYDGADFFHENKEILQVLSLTDIGYIIDMI